MHLFFAQLQESSQHHEFPIAGLGTQSVFLILEFLGWGTKSPDIPIGIRPQSYRGLCGILFNFEEGPKEDDIAVARVTFYKLYFLAFGIFASIWEAMKASFPDFEQVIERAFMAFEEMLKEFPSRAALDRYLIANWNRSCTLSRRGISQIFPNMVTL